MTAPAQAQATPYQAAERARFDAWFEQWRVATWWKPSEPVPAHWNTGCKFDCERGWLARARIVPLAPDHTGMRVDYTGLLKQTRAELRGGANAEMLRQLTDHLTELGARYYAGDLVAIDEFLQLYCIGVQLRAKLKEPGA